MVERRSMDTKRKIIGKRKDDYIQMNLSLSNIITIAVIVVGIGTTWGVAQYKINVFADDMKTVKKSAIVNKEDIIELKTKVPQIKETIDEIKVTQTTQSKKLDKIIWYLGKLNGDE